MIPEVRVLHVDDEPVICDLTKITLERGGRLKVDVVHSAQEALQLIQSRLYACIISDYEMPEMNGLDFLKEVRNIDKNIPFILFSGRGRETVIIDAINTGADFYIQKGGDPKALFAELNHKVEYAIQQRNTRLALKRRDAILEAVSLVSNLFLRGEPFERTIKEAITLFGLATDVDTVRLFRLEEEHSGKQVINYILNVASWTRITVHNPEREEFIQKGKIPVKHELLTTILKGDPLIPEISLSRSIDPCEGNQSAKSVAIFPIFVNQIVWGIIWFADYVSEREWTGVEVDALLAASSMIGSAIQQDMMRRSLIAAKEEYEAMYSLMRRLCDTVPDILWAKDTDGKYLFVNEAGARFIHAHDTHEPVGKTEDEFSIRSENPIQLSRKINPDNPETISIRTHGSAITDLEIVNVPFVNNEGEEIGIVTLGRDISRYIRIENLIRRSKERYGSIIEAVHIGVILIDKKGIVKTINKRAIDLIKAKSENIEGLSINQNPILREMELMDIVKDVIKSGNGISFLASRTITKTPEDLHCMVRLIVPENGNPAEVLITLDPHYTR